jgi:hypothetical protein
MSNLLPIGDKATLRQQAVLGGHLPGQVIALFAFMHALLQIRRDFHERGS